MPPPLAPASSACPLCGARELRAVLELDGVPTQDGVLWPTADEARRSPVGDIRLVVCERCSYVWNELHDPAKVRFTGYDVSLEHSPAFRAFVSELCARLTERYGLRGKTIVDIGSGRGHFLEEICAGGANTGVGIDPSTEPGERAPGLRFVRDTFSERHLDLAGDLYVCRHVIDILGDPLGLVDLIGRALDRSGPGAALYVEVPNARATFERLVIWNLVYEHRSWFVAESLAFLFASRGFEVIDVAPCWHDEYLGLEARRPVAPPPPAPVPADASGVADGLERFADRFERVRSDWAARLEALRADGRRAVVWGAGARGISFVSLLDTDGVVPYVVDVNPKRQGLYLPRTAHRVEPPEHLLADPPDLVVVSNPTYADEIRAQARSLGVRADLAVL